MNNEKVTNNQIEKRLEAIDKAMQELNELKSRDNSFVLCTVCDDGDRQCIGYSSSSDTASFVITLMANNRQVFDKVMALLDISRGIASQELSDDYRVEPVPV